MPAAAVAGFLPSTSGFRFGNDFPHVPLARVLFGEVGPAGKLPVDVPDANEPAKIRYPFGHGLSW